MKVALFVPCFVDAFFPEIGIATLELLERFGVEVEYPLDQTCCGQPIANSGCQSDAAPVEALFVKNFAGYEYIVTPSGSCTHHIRHHFDAIPQTDEVTQVRERTFELVEFLHDVLKVDAFPWAQFPHKVGLHNSCGTLRALRHASMSELGEPFFSKPVALLSKVEGIEFVTPAGPTSAAVSAEPSRFSRNRCRRRWATTRSSTTRTPAPSTSSPPICRA